MNTDDFNKQLKKKLEETFGEKFVNDKIVIMGLDNKDKNDKEKTWKQY